MKKIIFLTLILLFSAACRNTARQKALKAYAVAKAAQPVSVRKMLRFDFEQDKEGQLPPGWSAYATGRKNQTHWAVVRDGNNRVLAQLSSDNPNYHFNEAVYDKLSARNVDLKVEIKAIKGRKDQGGGLVWRFLDRNNYYVVRANPLENNVVLYKMENGRRSDLPLVGRGRTYGMDVPPLGKNTFELRVKVRDSLFTVYLNGKKLFDVVDGTFTGAGKTGLWTKADAVTYFDNLEIKVLDASK